MLKTKIFRVTPTTLKTINNFLKKSMMGSIIKQEFSQDEKKRLYLIVTIDERKNDT